MTPSTKVSVATLAAALGALIDWGLTAGLGLDVPAAVQAAIVVVLTFGLAYVVPEQNPSPSAVETVHSKGLK